MERLVVGKIELPRLTEAQIEEKLAADRDCRAEGIRIDRNRAISAQEAKRGIPTTRHPGIRPCPWQGGVLWGRAGTGKTREAISRLLSTRGFFFRCSDFVDIAREREMDRATEFDLTRYGLAFGELPVVLDDFGSRRPTAFALDALYNLIDHRWTYAKETLVTMNLSLDDVRRDWHERIASRMAGFGPVTEIAGKDWRQG